jgi:hypothetical protein
MVGTEFAIGTYVAIVAFLVAAEDSSRRGKARSESGLLGALWGRTIRRIGLRQLTPLSKKPPG